MSTIIEVCPLPERVNSEEWNFSARTVYNRNVVQGYECN